MLFGDHLTRSWSRLDSRSAFVLVVVVVSATLCRVGAEDATGAVSDSYVSRAEADCQASGDFYTCGKYRLARYIAHVQEASVVESDVTAAAQQARAHDAADGAQRNGTGAGTGAHAFPVRFVRIAEPDDALSLFASGSAAATSRESDSELGGFLHFVQRRVDRYLRTQGIALPLPRGVLITGDEDNSRSVGEARKKKKEIIIPLLILFTVFKVKVLVALTLIGIFFIKKVILLSALVLPSILHSLKMSCKHIIPHAHHEDYHDDSYAGTREDMARIGNDDIEPQKPEPCNSNISADSDKKHPQPPSAPNPIILVWPSKLPNT